MSDQDFWFEPVSILSRCSLNEGLLWVWAERVPVYNIYREKNAFETLDDRECEELKIAPVPDGVRRAAHYLTEKRLRTQKYGKMPKASLEYHVAKGVEQAEAVKQWIPEVTSAFELPAAELFLKLRRGEIEATGKCLPHGVEIIDFVEDQHSYSKGDFDDLVDSVIQPDFWTMPGIDWLTNAVTARGNCYCDISMPVEVLMRLFPGKPTPIQAQFVGNCVLVKQDASDNVIALPRRAPGRPPTYAWEPFHVEVADLIKSGRMPRKKEAAIQYMITWFASTPNSPVPSRSAVSEKLTPYYRRFFSEAE